MACLSGPSERWATLLFTGIQEARTVVRRSTSPYRVRPRVSAADLHLALPRDPRPVPGPHFPGAIHLRMLEQYAAASVIVNERLDVVHISGRGAF
jgi:hypothetical protein